MVCGWGEIRVCRRINNALWLSLYLGSNKEVTLGGAPVNNLGRRSKDSTREGERGKGRLLYLNRIGWVGSLCIWKLAESITASWGIPAGGSMGRIGFGSG